MGERKKNDWLLLILQFSAAGFIAGALCAIVWQLMLAIVNYTLYR